MRKSIRLVSVVIATILSTLILFACGGGGGGGGSSPAQEGIGNPGEGIRYTGETTAANISSNNANKIFLYIWGGGYSSQSTPVLSKAMTVKSSSGTVPMKSISASVININHMNSQVLMIAPAVNRSGQLKAASKAQEINQTFNGTISGSVTYKGTINDDGTGILSITYTNYNNGDETTLDGDAVLSINAYDLTRDIIINSDMTMRVLTFSSATDSISLSGSVHIENNIVRLDSTETFNVDGRNEFTKETFRLDNFSLKQTYDHWDFPTKCVETLTGRIYIETEGYVDINQTNPFIYNHFGQFNVDVPESGGPLIFNGAAGSREKITPLSISQFNIEVDADGDGIFEINNTYLWSTLVGVVYTFEQAIGQDSGYEEGYSVQATTDGGYIVTGYRNSNSTNRVDVLLLKTNAVGEAEWEKTFGGTNDEFGRSVLQTSDGGFLIVGYTYPFPSVGQEDIYIVKADANGNLIWAKTFGGSDSDWAYSMTESDDGGFVIAGATGTGWKNVYLLKITSNGNKVWEKTFGTTYYQVTYSVKTTSDGGYIMAGYKMDVMTGYDDIYIIKTDANGILEWDQQFGGTYHDYAFSIDEASTGGYVVVGSSSNAGYLAKMDVTGKVLWEKIIDIAPASVKESADDGFVITGGCNVRDDVCLIKTDKNGEVQWRKIFDGIWYDYMDSGYEVQKTLDGGFIIVGYTSTIEDYPLGFQKNIYLIKTDSNGNI